MAAAVLMPRPPPQQAPVVGVGFRPRTPSSTRGVSSASAAVAARLRDSSSSRSVNSFFADIQKEMSYEWQELSEEEQALQAILRAQRRLGGGASLSAQSTRRSASATVLPPANSTNRGSQRQVGSTRRSASIGGLPAPRKQPPISADGAAALADSGAKYRQEWEMHHEAWENFQEDPPATISVDTVPWPPCADDVLEFVERLQAHGDQKQAYHLACRRWHPDKFFQIYGERVHEDDKPDLTAKLNEIFHALTLQWDRRHPRKSKGRMHKWKVAP